MLYKRQPLQDLGLQRMGGVLGEGGQGHIPRTNTRAGGFQAHLEETEVPLISTLLESRVEMAARHTDTPQHGDRVSKELKGKRKDLPMKHLFA